MRTCICSKSINVKCATALTEVVMFKTRVSDTAEPIIPTHNCLPDDRCLHVALLVMALLGMSTKPFTTRATTVSRSGCVQHADKVVIPNFSLAGSVLSRNHSLATIVHELLEWPWID